MDKTVLTLAVDSSQVGTAAAALERMTGAGNAAATAGAKVTTSATAQGKALSQTAEAAKKGKVLFTDLAAAAEQLSPRAMAQIAAALAATATEAAKASTAVLSLNRAASATPQISVPTPFPVTTAAPSARTPLASPQPIGVTTGVSTGVSVPTAALAGDATRAQTAIERLTAAATAQRSALTQLAPVTATTAASYRQLAAAPIRVAAPEGLSAAAAALASVSNQANAARASLTALNTAAPVTAPARAAATAGATLATAARQAQSLAAPTAAAGEAARLTTAQMQGLSHSVRSFVDMVAAGQSPIRAFGLEAARLQGTFGSAGGAFRAITSLFTPMRLALGGVATAIGAVGYAFYEGAKQSRAFADAVVLSGNYAGQTEGKLNALTREIASHGQATASAAREAAQALIGSGQVGPQVFAAATEAVTLYAQATSKTTEEVVKDFAEMARSPSKWAEEHNRALNFITAAQYDAIKSFEDGGKAADAQGIIYEALNERLKKLDPNLGTIERTLRSVKNAWSSFWDAAYDIGRTDTIENKIAGLDSKIRGARTDKNPFAAAPQSRTAQLAKANQQGQSGDEYALQDLLAAKARKDADATNEATGREVQKAGIAAKAVVDGYLKRGKAASAYKDALEKLNRSFKDNEAAGTPVSAADKKIALTELKKEFTPAKSAGAGEAQQVLRAQLETDIKGIKDALDAEKERLSFQQHYLDGVYQAGQISLKDFYDTRRTTIAEGVDAELKELDKEAARLEQYKKATKDPSEKVVTQTRINEVQAQKEKVTTAASHDVVLVNQEEAASFKALSEQVTNYRANLLQMQGDEAGAAALRAQTVIANAKLLATQAKNLPGSPSVDVSGLARAITLTDQFNEVQRRSQLLASSSSRAEEAYLLAAEQSGKSLQDTERGLYAVRSTELTQLGALAAKAKELADASTDPRIKAFAADLALEYAKAANAVDPALNRLRDANKELAAGLAQSVGNAPNAFVDFYNQRRSQSEQDIKSQKDEYDKRIDQLRGYLSQEKDVRNKATLQKRIDQLQGESDGLKGESKGKTALTALNETVFKPIAQQVSATISKILIQEPLQKYFEGQLKGLTEGDGPLAGIFKDALGIKADPKQAALLQQTAAINASSSALDTLKTAAESAANALNKPLAGTQSGEGSGVLGGPGAQAGSDPSQPAPVDAELAGAGGEAVQSLAAFSKEATSTASDIVKLANAAGAGGDAMGRLPGIIGLFQSAVAAMQGSSASGGSSGIGGFIGSLFGGSGEAASYEAAVASSGIFHSGGIVGQPPATRNVSMNVFAGAPRYHTGGIVGKAADKAGEKLKHNEVPAILMGGPKGRREEVLRADDPRHRDNLGMSIVARILAESKSTKQPAVEAANTAKKIESRSAVSTLIQSIAGSKGEGESSTNVLAGLLDRMGVRDDEPSATKVRGARELGGPVSAGGMYRVNEKGPELLEVAGKQYLMMGQHGGRVESSGATANGRASGDTHIHLTVAPPAGASRATAMQFGAAAGRQMQIALRRNG